LNTIHYNFSEIKIP